MELFCTPKSSMDNLSLRVNRHGGSTSDTFIVENYVQDEFGQWATDEVRAEQGHIDDERYCFWTWDDKECIWQSRPLKGRQVRRKGKGKGKGGFKGTGRAFLGEEQAQDPELRSEEDCAWWSIGKGGKKGFSKDNEGFCNGGFRNYPAEKGASNDFNPHKGRGKDQKGKGTEGAYLQSGLSASANSAEEGQGHPWESGDWYSSFTDDSSCSTAAWFGTGHTAWMASVPLNLAHHPPHVVLVESCNQKVPDTCVVSWGYDRILPLQ